MCKPKNFKNKKNLQHFIILLSTLGLPLERRVPSAKPENVKKSLSSRIFYVLK